MRTLPQRRRATALLAVVGLSLWALALLGDTLGVASTPGVNWKQVVLASLGIAMVLVGVIVGRGDRQQAGRTLARRNARWLITAALSSVVAVNTVMVNTGYGAPVWIGFPWTDHRGALVSDLGYIENSPREGGILNVFQSAADDGIERMSFDGISMNTGGFNLNTLSSTAWTARMEVIAPWEAHNLGPNGLYALRAPMQDVDAPPCLRMYDNFNAVYFTRGGPPGPSVSFYCPPILRPDS